MDGAAETPGFEGRHKHTSLNQLPAIEIGRAEGKRKSVSDEKPCPVEDQLTIRKNLLTRRSNMEADEN